MPDPDWWQALWPEPEKVLFALGVRSSVDVVDLCVHALPGVAGDRERWGVRQSRQRETADTRKITLFRDSRPAAFRNSAAPWREIDGPVPFAMECQKSRRLTQHRILCGGRTGAVQTPMRKAGIRVNGSNCWSAVNVLPIRAIQIPLAEVMKEG
jgi:hypothetical protein